jgi:hypothetical protein
MSFESFAIIYVFGFIVFGVSFIIADESDYHLFWRCVNALVNAILWPFMVGIQLCLKLFS